MKSLKSVLIAVIAVMACSISVNAQIFRWGPRLGVEVNKMSFNSNVFDSNNRAGFTGGLMAEINVPVIGLGFDLSVMYVHRVNNASTTGTNPDDQTLVESSRFKNRDYIEIPLNLKYKIGLPVVGKIITPYVFTGPSFSFLTSKKEISQAFENKSFDVAWNFGIGLQLINHLQVSASYGLGLNNSIKKLSTIAQGTEIDGKNKYWTVTAAWLF